MSINGFESYNTNAERGTMATIVEKARASVLSLALTLPVAGCGAQQAHEAKVAEPVTTTELSEPDLVQQEAEVSQDVFTPRTALRDALSSPFRFIGRGDGDAVGIAYPVCLWRNQKVLMRSDYCAPLSKAGVASCGVTGEVKDFVAGVHIYSPEGDEVKLYAEVDPSQSVYDAEPSAYNMFKVEYSDLSSVTPRIGTIASFDDYVRFDEARDNDDKRSNCWEASEWVSTMKDGSEVVGDHVSVFDENVVDVRSRNLDYVECVDMESSKAGTWEKEGTEFRKNPPQEWFAFLKRLEAMYDEHGFK